MFSANSSGAILAAYFTCWGVSEETIKEAKKMLEEFDYSLINEDVMTKAKNLTIGATTEFPHENIIPLIHQVLTRKGKKCEPKSPLAIVAANGDVLDSRVKRRFFGKGWSPILSSKEKTIDLTNFSVRVRKTGDEIGKACTYFVTKAMFESLSKIPYATRLCELRLIETFEDLFLALLATVSEPTYFPQVSETNPEKIKNSDMPLPQNRFYVGGFLLPVVAQDILLSNPQTLALGTGQNPVSRLVDTLPQTWYLVSGNRSLEEGTRWLHVNVTPTILEGSPDATPKKLYQAGYEEALKLLTRFKKRCSN